MYSHSASYLSMPLGTQYNQQRSLNLRERINITKNLKQEMLEQLNVCFKL